MLKINVSGRRTLLVTTADQAHSEGTKVILAISITKNNVQQ